MIRRLSQIDTVLKSGSTGGSTGNEDMLDLDLT